jgi:hypothetical protein
MHARRLIHCVGGQRLPARIQVRVSLCTKTPPTGLQHAISRYEHYNTTHPMLTRGGVGLALYFVGDCCAQAVESRSSTGSKTQSGELKNVEAAAESFDAGRAARTCSWRAIIHTPIIMWMYSFLDHRFPGQGVRQVCIKMFFDLAIMAPPVFASFLFWCKFLEEGDAASAIEHTQTKLYDALLYSYAFWVPTHVFTYGLVPRKSLLWFLDCSLSHMTPMLRAIIGHSS